MLRTRIGVGGSKPCRRFKTVGREGPRTAAHRQKRARTGGYGSPEDGATGKQRDSAPVEDETTQVPVLPGLEKRYKGGKEIEAAQPPLTRNEG